LISDYQAPCEDIFLQKYLKASLPNGKRRTLSRGKIGMVSGIFFGFISKIFFKLSSIFYLNIIDDNFFRALITFGSLKPSKSKYSKSFFFAISSFHFESLLYKFNKVSKPSSILIK
jgi:hypothetical protein